MSELRLAPLSKIRMVMMVSRMTTRQAWLSLIISNGFLPCTVGADQDGDDLIKEAVDESALCDRTSVPASLIPNNGKKCDRCKYQ